MSHKFIAAILAGAIAITGISTHNAQAGERELARFLAGAAALVVIGAAIKQDNDRKRRAAAQPVYVEPQRYYQTPTKKKSHIHESDVSRDNNRYDDRYDNRYDNRHNKYSHIEPRPLPRGIAKKLLPPKCERTARTRQGPISVFSAGCLRDNYKYSHKLPQVCETRVRYGRDGKLGYAYGAECLGNHGYEIANR